MVPGVVVTEQQFRAITAGDNSRFPRATVATVLLRKTNWLGNRGHTQLYHHFH